MRSQTLGAFDYIKLKKTALPLGSQDTSQANLTALFGGSWLWKISFALSKYL
jgi:hypothetical protein